MNPDYLNAWQTQGKSDADLYGSTGLSPEQIQSLISKGLVTSNTRNYSNESGSGTTTDYQANWANLPQVGPDGAARYGNWMPANPDLIHPDMVYNDPNYGYITPAFNDKSNLKNGYDLIGPIFAAILTAGVGGLAAAGVGAAEAAGAGAAEASSLAAAEAAGEGGAGAAAGGFATGGSTPFVSGTPWYTNALMRLPNAAKTLSNVHWSEVLGGSPDPAPAAATPQATPDAAPKTTPQAAPDAAVTTGLPPSYNPSLFGNMGSFAAPPDGSAPVASGIAPDAYQSSYNQVVS